MSLECFEDALEHAQIDRKAFKLTHKLIDHPALALENLSVVIPRLPKSQVMFSTSKLANGDDFEATFRKRPKDAGIEQTLEQLRTSNSYIMVARPEADDSFADLKNMLVSDVRSLMRKAGLGSEPLDPHLYLFIASPRSVTPFHIDRYSTLLLQFRGSKTVRVFGQWDRRAVTCADREAYVAYARTKLPWNHEIDAIGQDYSFTPGEALHIPFVAGHHVANGPDDVSISMSIIFNTQESQRWRQALAFNYALRKKLGSLPIGLETVGRSRLIDGTKAMLWRAMGSRN